MDYDYVQKTNLSSKLVLCKTIRKINLCLHCQKYFQISSITHSKMLSFFLQNCLFFITVKRWSQLRYIFTYKYYKKIKNYNKNIYDIDWTRRHRRVQFMRFHSTTVVSIKSLRYNLLLHRSSVKCWLLSRVLPHRAYSPINGYHTAVDGMYKLH